ncbi:MAG: hypothetical protein NZM11_08940 [Anaerolineales bacterium]|nr:hypothetical protein [Anaerolineales bacterium]
MPKTCIELREFPSFVFPHLFPTAASPTATARASTALRQLPADFGLGRICLGV